MCKALAQCGSLQDVQLKNTDLQPEAAIALAESLSSMPSDAVREATVAIPRQHREGVDGLLRFRLRLEKGRLGADERGLP